MRWTRGESQPTRAIFFLVSTVLLGAVAADLLVNRRVPTVEVLAGLAVAGVALVSAGVVLRGGWRRPRDAVFRRWLGVGMLVWGTGQFVNCLLAADGVNPPFPTVGDVISLAAAPFAVAGFLAIPRRVVSSHSLARLVLDTGLLSVALSLVTWRLLFAGSQTRTAGTVAGAIALAMVAEIVVCALAVVSALRDLEIQLMAIAVGCVCFMLGSVWMLPDGDALVPQALPGQVLWAVAWPLVVWGLLSHQPAYRPTAEPAPIEVDPDARVTLITTVTSLVLLIIGLGAMLTQAPEGPSSPRVDAVSWSLLLAAVGLLVVRELLNARIRLRLLRRLHLEATSDPLTGLGNRRMLTTRLADVLPGQAWCLIVVDLDGFKGINDLLGHSVGDRLLCAVAERLPHNLPRTALVCRTGGDEFAILLPGRLPAGVAAADVVLATVRRSSWDVEGITRLPVTASVGVTAVGGFYPVPELEGGTTDDPLSALSAAGAALQLAKSGGRDRVEVFDGAAALVRSRRLSVEERLRSAIQTGELDVRFQPVVNLRTGAITGVEALARWVDPRLGTINPQEFIPVAEQTGLVVALGQHVLTRTVELATEHGLPQRGIRVACNVSPLQLRVSGFPQLVEDVLSTYSMPPGMLLVEVTEAVFVEEDGPAVRALHRLADAGVTVAIDDFGTGYSALGYLRRIPANALKIDRSLTSALVDEPQARAITRAVIDLGTSLGVAIIVEGIETSDVAELVTSMGAGFGQGTLYGSAMPMCEIVRLSRRPLGLRLA